VRPLLIALFVLAAAPASAGEPSAGYDVTLESPGGPASGSVAVRVRVSGGVRDAEQAAFHLRTAGSWRQDASIGMARVEENVFEAVLDTTLWPNAAYRLEVRVWGDVPPYDPDEPSTFARALSDVAVENAPPTPSRLEGLTRSPGVRLGWPAVETADREDFVGYRVLARKGTTCPAAVEAYRTVATLSQLLFASDRIGEGHYCFRVVAVRSSPVSGQIASPPTPGLRVQVVGGSAPGVEAVDAPVPPPPPPLGEGHVEVSDGEFVEGLPYDPQTVTTAVDGESSSSPAREAGSDPRRMPTSIAVGLILMVSALLLRRFLTAPSLP
jgi:hypothetical protein